MMTTNEVGQVFDTVLSIPGMNEAVRVDMKITRKAVLLLHQIIMESTSDAAVPEGMSIISYISAEARDELKGLATDCLQKAGLVEMSEKLLKLSSLGKKQ